MSLLCSLEDKVAIVTGGKEGIGKAIALAFAGAGADVIVCGRNIEDGQLRAVSEEARRLGRRSLAIQADVTRKTDVDNLVRRAIDELGSIDILVNNAGTFAAGPMLDLAEDEWDRVMDTDLKSCYLCCQAAGKKMVAQQRGTIINIASTQAIKVAAERGAYAIAKAGVIVLTRVLARELARYNIRVNAIAPGPAKTKMIEHVWRDPNLLQYWEAQIPLGRLGEVSDIARVALFLASDLAGYVTGQTIAVDGGFVA